MFTRLATRLSTENASLELIDRIQQQLDTKADPFAIFVDFSKAFDTIGHHILLHKLSYYGIQDKALNLFKDYLSNRTQYVLMDKISSTSRKIYTGVPQGSILGPLLFIIYINEMHTISNKFGYYCHVTPVFTLPHNFILPGISVLIQNFVINTFKVTYPYRWRRLTYKYTLSKYTTTCYSWIVEYDM